MDKKDTLKAIKVMQAYVDGKEIEWFNEDHWEKITDPCWEWDEDNPQYRIKPEPHYRPFKNAEEVMEAIKEHGGFVIISRGAIYKAIVAFAGEFIRIGETTESYESAYENFVFADDTPFGVKEE